VHGNAPGLLQKRLVTSPLTFQLSVRPAGMGAQERGAAGCPNAGGGFGFWLASLLAHP
jgi:hypothetical protein